MDDRDSIAKRPVDPRTHERLPVLAQPGYYPGFSTLAQQRFWDAETRRVVLARVEKTPPIRFFSEQEAALFKAIADRVLPQDDRDPSRRIPIVNGLDARLFEKKGDGYRYEKMPPDGEAHRLGLQAIDTIARHLHGRGFRELDSRSQDEVLLTLHDNKPPAAHDIWARMPVHRYWLMLVKDVVEEYYAHPWAWDEIGFGGPAYPRGYMRLENGEPEPWEVDERRYEWDAPEGSLSDRYSDVGGSDEPAPGQGGTH
jgi:hypothetical protein